MQAEPVRSHLAVELKSYYWNFALTLVAFIALPLAANAQAQGSDRQQNVDWRAEAGAAGNVAAKNEPPDSLEKSLREYRIGTDDVVEIKVFEASELDGKLRVSASGEISMPLLGAVRCGGMTARELENALAERLHPYMKDPHVGVFVTTVESHPISVVGAVKKPGVFQVRGPKSVLEMLSMAEGIADDAGESLLVMRGSGAPSDPKSVAANANTSDATEKNGTESDTASANDKDVSAIAPGAKPTTKINLNKLLKSEDPALNVEVYPGDIVKVVKADVIYVVGEVKRPGGFILKNDQRMSVLKAVALAEGLTPTSAKSAARILRTDVHGGQREEIPINLGKILAGKAPDPTLSAADIVFIPNSSSKSVIYKGSEAAISALTSLLIFRW